MPKLMFGLAAQSTVSALRSHRLQEQRHRGFSGRRLHIIFDNLNTRKQNEPWLKAQPDVQFHFTPTSASWLKQLELWVFDLAGSVTQRHLLHKPQATSGTHRRLVNAYNDKAKPFVWTKKKVRQCRFKVRRITQL
ncbi:hypothetical protein ACVWZR_001962 [Bradyrhizobium sp. i1.3.1]